jgi:hypothetical protein
MNTELIVNELARRGYRKAPQPLHVADIDFDFDAALTGPNDQDSLTLVLEGDPEKLLAAQRRLRAFAIVLERIGSSRPINVVVLAKHPDPKSLALLEESARVILVEPDVPLEQSLRPLLPLELPQPVDGSVSADSALLDMLGARPDTVSSRLIKAARESSEKVQATMRKILQDMAEPHS